MIIIKTKQYLKSYKKNIIDKHRHLEEKRIESIENLILSSKNLQNLITSPYKNVYHLEQKHNNLKEYYTARINSKIRLIMKPIGDFPYNKVSIEEIEFIDINHYKE